MKVMRFEPPAPINPPTSRESRFVGRESSTSRGQDRVGFVDLANSTVVDAATVLSQVGVEVPLIRAVDIIAYNTEQAGALARELRHLSKYDGPRWPLNEVSYRPPIEAGSLRDFIAFERHIKTLRNKRGDEVPPAWYQMPVYYKGNPRSLIGHDQPVNWPRYTEQLDFELEMACILGKEGQDVAEAGAEAYIGGYAVLNDWSARDIQYLEMSVGLGPSKGKDFATSLGPWVVTPDEFNSRNARMTARINGELWSDGNIGQIHWSFPQMIAHVSMDETVYPGDIFGSGTVGGGCGAELDRWIQPGDVVELEVEGIGLLRNRVVRKPS